jgi:ketosteroid isomerase-like protein
MKLKLVSVAVITGIVLATVPAMVFADQAQVETKIKAALEQYSVAWNNANVEGVISLYSEDARIAEGQNKNIVTKAKYRELLPGKFSRFGKMTFQGEPVVTMNDDGTSKVKLTAQYSGLTTLVRFVFLFKKANDVWLIYDQDY